MSVVAGALTVASYALISVLSGPFNALVILTSLLGPLLAAASLGLYYVLEGAGNAVLLQLAVTFNILGASIFTMMGLVQLAVRHQLRQIGGASEVRPLLATSLAGVQLGLDVAWDVFLGAGTFLFAVAMVRDPRFGWGVGAAGALLAAGLVALNLSTFPTPPAERGRPDLGPLIGLWYLVVVLLTLRWLLASAA